MPSTLLDPIREQVSRLTTVVDSNKALLTLLTEKILNAVSLEEAQAIAKEVQDQVDELSADVIANTPVEPTPPTE